MISLGVSEKREGPSLPPSCQPSVKPQDEEDPSLLRKPSFLQPPPPPLREGGTTVGEEGGAMPTAPHARTHFPSLSYRTLRQSLEGRHKRGKDVALLSLFRRLCCCSQSGCRPPELSLSFCPLAAPPNDLFPCVLPPFGRPR